MSKKNRAIAQENDSANVNADADNTATTEKVEHVEEAKEFTGAILVNTTNVRIGPFVASMEDVLKLSAKNKALGPFDVIAARYFRAKGVRVICEDDDAKAIVEATNVDPNGHIISVTVGKPTKEPTEKLDVKKLIEMFPGRKFTRINLGAAEALDIKICQTTDEVADTDGVCWFKGYLVRPGVGKTSDEG